MTLPIAVCTCYWPWINTPRATNSALLSGQTDIREISTAESVEEVLSLAARHAFDLVMVSTTFGASHGLSLTYSRQER
jgi:hypothetical protein